MKTWAYDLALRIAFTSKYKKHLHGSVIELGGRIIAKGTNSLKPLAPPDGKYSIHAEVAAMNRAGIKAVGATLYVVKVNKKGIKNSEPCKDCVAEIKKSGIKKVCYSIGPNRWGEWRVY